MEKISYQFLQHVLNDKTKLEDSLQEEIIRIKATDFLIYIFNHYNGAAFMTRSFYLLFPFWKTFNFDDWQTVFKQITDKNSGQYYLNYNFKSLLGIDLGVIKNLHKTTDSEDFNEIQMLPGVAVFEMEGTMRKRLSDQLSAYGITLSELKDISKHLIRNGATSIHETGNR